MKVIYEMGDARLKVSADLVRLTGGTIATAPGAAVMNTAMGIVVQAGDVTVILPREEFNWIVNLIAMGVGDDQRHRGIPQ